MKIYTKTGDTGKTSLIGGTRVYKHHLRIEAYGTVDELNSYMGLIGCQSIPDSTKAFIKQIQDRLFTLGASLASDPEKSKMIIPDLFPSDIEALELEMDSMNESLPDLKNFILPGGNNLVSFCHIARCVCRRAERLAVALHEESPIDDKIISYLNRLSDYLFVLARKFNHDAKLPEHIWRPRD